MQGGVRADLVLGHHHALGLGEEGAFFFNACHQAHHGVVEVLLTHVHAPRAPCRRGTTYPPSVKFSTIRASGLLYIP